MKKIQDWNTKNKNINFIEMKSAFSYQKVTEMSPVERLWDSRKIKKGFLNKVQK